MEELDRAIEVLEPKSNCSRDIEVFAESSETEGFVGELAERWEIHPKSKVKVRNHDLETSIFAS